MPYQPRHSARALRKPSKTMRQLKAVMLLLLAALVIWPFAEPFTLETETVTIESADLPKDVGTLRIVYLTDIHFGPFYSLQRVTELVSRVNALNPDIILLGGDYGDTSGQAIAFFEQAPAFHARYAVCGVVGNHDRTVPESNLPRLKSAMRTAGVIPLVNEVTRIRIGSSEIVIAGIDDIDNGWPDLANVAAQTRSGDFTIFLCHNPSVIPEAQQTISSDGSRTWFDLGLFGHTHGGQVSVIGRLLNPTSTPARYQQGWLTENRANLLISRGVGTTFLPVRFMCMPQIHLITVKPAK